MEIKSTQNAQVVVLYHGYRNLQLLRLGRQVVTSERLRAGFKPFGSAGISSDTKTNTIDSMLIELSSTPASSSSCYRTFSNANPTVTNNCPALFQLDTHFLEGTNLEMYIKPNKILIFGLGNTSFYQQLLHEVTLTSQNSGQVTTRTSEFSVRVYISDINGIASSSKTITVQIQTSSSRKRREVINEDSNYVSHDEKDTHKSFTISHSEFLTVFFIVLLCIVAFIGLIFVVAFKLAQY